MQKGNVMVKTKVEYRVWIWNKVVNRYLILPATLSTKAEAVSYVVSQKKEWQNIRLNLDYSNYQIKSREVSYTEWELV